jgi:hypothetical protein
VVAPNSDGLNFPKESNRLLDPLPRIENVAQDNEALRPMLLKLASHYPRFEVGTETPPAYTMQGGG